MGKGFKVLLLADEDPELRNYVKNVVKERVGNMEEGLLIDVVKNAIIENSGKLANMLNGKLDGYVREHVATFFGKGKGQYYSVSEREKEIKALIDLEIRKRVDDLITPEMVQSIVRSAVERKVGELINLVSQSSKKG